MTTSQPSDIFQPGDLLNTTYRIEEILGRGGTSEVYKARSEISGKVMAIKALKSEFASNEDFLVLMTREEDVREIRHDAVVRYFDTQRMPNGVVYLVMDHVDGPGLDKKLAEGGMPASDLLVVGKRICEGLVAAHARNIVHRDLSPDNILLRNDRPDGAVIIDFGIAKDTNPGAETIVGNEFAGKYAYAAPEQLSGQADERSDLYSLGALLLSTFRGEKPDVGANPMETVQKKSEPLDVTGVPQPLRGLIEKMTAPNPDDRFSSAHELLEAFRNPEAFSLSLANTGSETTLDDATVFSPAPAAPQRASGAIGLPQSSQSKGANKPEPKSGRGALVPILAVVLVVGGGAGAFFSGALDGLITPKYPEADPFVLLIEKTASGAVRASGNVPSPEIQVALDQTLSDVGGVSELSLASGNISDGWGNGVLEVVGSILPLEEFLMKVEGDQISISGLAFTRSDQSVVRTSLGDPISGAFSVSADIGLGPRILPTDILERIVSNRADCGPLQLVSSPPIGYGLEDAILVQGQFAAETTRASLESDLTKIAGDRPVRVEGETLNETLCQIDAVLPDVSTGGFDIRLGFGGSSATNLSGRYKVGDNPTIDVKLPNSIESGYLWVSVLDVKGVVYHLLPNISRPNNRVDALIGDVDSEGFLRVAYGHKEANGRLAFNVGGDILGKSRVIVLHSDNALFNELRPTTESAASYAEALTESIFSGAVELSSLDSVILITEE